MRVTLHLIYNNKKPYHGQRQNNGWEYHSHRGKPYRHHSVKLKSDDYTISHVHFMGGLTHEQTCMHFIVSPRQECLSYISISILTYSSGKHHSSELIKSEK